MRVAGEPLAVSAYFATEMIEVIFVEPAFEKRAGVYAWCCVSLEVHMVSRYTAFFSSKEMVEANFIQAC